VSGKRDPDFGAVLKLLRDDRRLTQEELADAARVSVRTISDLERGVNRTARKATARLLADSLELTGTVRDRFVAAALGLIPAAEVLAAREDVPVSAEPEIGAASVRYSLPPDSPMFTGRDGEMSQIIAAISGAAEIGDVPAIHVIDGMPGVGKTALAVHVAHALRDRFPERQLFIDLHGHTPGQKPVSASMALAGLLTASGIDARYLPEDVEGRAGLWRDRMSGKRALLVLDNAAGSSQVAPLLPGGNSCAVLVTSRRHLGDLPGLVVPVLMDVLPSQRAAEMFTRLASRPAGSPAEVAEIVRVAGYLPLAISLLARVFARHPSWTLGDLAAETRAGVLTLTAENDNVAAAFTVSYRYLDSAQQQLFRLLGLHLGTTIEVYAAAALIGTSLEQAASLLEGLQGEGLLIEIGHRRYALHDLLRRYARDLAEADSSQVRQQALNRLLDHYQHTAARAEARLARQTQPGRDQSATSLASVPVFEQAAQALGWARAERANLVNCLDYAVSTGQDARIVTLTAAITTLLRRDGPWNDAITRHSAAAQAARRLGDRLGWANALNHRADLRRMTGDFPGAAQDHEQALIIYRDLGNQLGEANALHGLADVRTLIGDYSAANELLEHALGLYRDLGDRQGEANADTYLGDVRRMTGDLPGAVRAHKRALGIYLDLGDRLGEANALHNLGIVRRMMGDFPSAVRAHEQALVIYRADSDQRGTANALTFLGMAQRQTGDYPGAAANLEQALGIWRDFGSRLGEANALTFLGIVRRETNEHPRAARELEHALRIYRELGDRGGEAEALNELGTLHRTHGDLEQAQQCHQQALDLARAITSSWDEAHALAGLGRCALAAGHAKPAQALLRQARELFQGIGAAEVNTVIDELEAIVRQNAAKFL
jgi:tetratricopeptide (TPR) repeat protein/transcriptional regulator with XRE-family HTH domain